MTLLWKIKSHANTGPCSQHKSFQIRIGYSTVVIENGIMWLPEGSAFDALLYAPLKSLFHFHMAEAPLWCMMVAFWHYQFSHGKSTSWCKSSNYMEWTPAIPPGSAVLSWLMWSTCLGKAGTADGEVSWCTWRTGLADAETSASWGLDLGGSIAAPSWSSQHQGCHMCSTINCSKNFVNHRCSQDPW